MANELQSNQLARETLVGLEGGSLRATQLARETLVGMEGGKLLARQLVRETLVSYSFSPPSSGGRRQALLGGL